MCFENKPPRTLIDGEACWANSIHVHIPAGTESEIAKEWVADLRGYWKEHAEGESKSECCDREHGGKAEIENEKGRERISKELHKVFVFADLVAVDAQGTPQS